MVTTQQTIVAPAEWLGSLPEFIVFQALRRLGKQPGVDFIFQSSFFGGRLEKGGLIIDFLFLNPPDLAINVQGEFFHQEKGAPVIARDKMARAQLAGQGIRLIFIDEQDVLSDAEGVVRAALQYRDLSFLGGG
jgi:hypothetical protein